MNLITSAPQDQATATQDQSASSSSSSSSSSTTTVTDNSTSNQISIAPQDAPVIQEQAPTPNLIAVPLQDQSSTQATNTVASGP